MHKILIVEDDVMYRYAIRTLIDATDGRYFFLEDAINGVHALELIGREKPDIIITDISMPEMDGVELIRRVKAANPEIRIIVLSAYDDFLFVKEALKLGAEDYLLKYEMGEKCVKELLTQISQKIENEKSEGKRAEFLQKNSADLIGGIFKRTVATNETDPEKVEEFLDLLFPDKPRFPIAICVFNTTSIGLGKKAAWEAAYSSLKNSAEGNPRLFVIPYGECTLPLVVNLASIQEPEQTLGKFEPFLHIAADAVSVSVGTKTSIGTSRVINGGEQFVSAYREALRAAELGYYCSRNALFRAETNPPEGRLSGAREQIISAVILAMESGDLDTALGSSRRFFDEFRREQPVLEMLDEFIRCLFSELFVFAKKRSLDFQRITGFNSVPPSAKEIAPSLDELERLVDDCLKNFASAESSPESSYRREIRLGIEYIKKHYRTGIQLPDLAAKLGLSPNYLCSLFRAETGMRLLEYVRKVRINKATTLLKETNLKVYEIAELTGFSTSSQFCKAFKEEKGISVTEFRETLG